MWKCKKCGNDVFKSYEKKITEITDIKFDENGELVNFDYVDEDITDYEVECDRCAFSGSSIQKIAIWEE